MLLGYRDALLWAVICLPTAAVFGGSGLTLMSFASLIILSFSTVTVSPEPNPEAPNGSRSDSSLVWTLFEGGDRCTVALAARGMRRAA